MTSKIYLQVLAQQIKSNPFPDDVLPQASNSAGTSSLHLTHPATSGINNSSIVSMQRELFALAQDITQTPVELDTNNKQISDPINNFIAQNYLEHPKEVEGVSFNHQPVQANVITDAMNYVVNLSERKFVDGGWGEITNTALKNAYAFAVAIITAAEDLKIPITYSEEQLSQFRNQIPMQASELTSQQKSENAADNAKQLAAIRKMYQEVKAGIKPHDIALLTGNQSVHTYQAPQTFNNQIIQQLNQTFNQQLSVDLPDQNGRIVSLPISVNDLLSPQTLTNWQKLHAPNTPVANILQAVKTNINQLGKSI